MTVLATGCCSLVHPEISHSFFMSSKKNHHPSFFISHVFDDLINHQINQKYSCEFSRARVLRWAVSGAPEVVMARRGMVAGASQVVVERRVMAMVVTIGASQVVVSAPGCGVGRSLVAVTGAGAGRLYYHNVPGGGQEGQL